MKKNCWEFMKCGREPREERQGTVVCPAAAYENLMGLMAGKRRQIVLVDSGYALRRRSSGQFRKKNMKAVLNANFITSD
jgi:hypothetical protein